MLTKNLLEVRKKHSSGEMEPKYRHPEGNEDIARKVLDVYEPGKTKKEIWDRLEGLETHSNFKFLRGLSKVLERHSGFVSDPPSEPEMHPKEVRERLWEDGFVTSEAERNRRVAELAKETDMTTVEIDDSFRGDREENEKLVETVEVSPKELIEKYNLSLTQTLLFDAIEFEFKLGGEADYQKVFSNLKRLGLMYTVDEDLKVSVTGPAALFKRTRKYGTAMAKLLPTILESEEWTLYAKVESEAPYDDSRSKKIYDFELSSIPDEEDVGTGEYPDTEYLPDFASNNSLVEEDYDSEVERSFASRIDQFTEGWEVTREPTILRVDYPEEEGEDGGIGVMIPDFGFKRKTADREFYLEIVGFWTPDYLADKIEKVRNVETDPDISLVLAVNEKLRATEEEFGDVDEVFFYDKQVPVKPVVERLKKIESELKERDLLSLSEDGLEETSFVEEEETPEIGEIARREGYDPEAVSEYLSESESFPGVVYKEVYVPEEMVEAIQEEIESTDLSLPSVREVLEEYGLGEGFLENVGYEIRWEGFGDEDAKIVESE